MPFTRRTFLGASASMAVNAPMPQAPAPLQRPNLILYMTDELRAESVGCYGHPLVKTPNIDRLASEGTRFVQCHVANPVCGPSRCSFATGWPVHVRGHRSLYYALHPDEPNLFRYLKDGGYDVYWFGKNDLLSADSFPLSVTRWGSGGGRGAPAVTGLGGSGNPYPPGDPHYYSFLNARLPDRRRTGDYANVQAAIDVLRRPAQRPFCLYLPLTYPHPPYAAPEDFHDMYKPADLPPLRPFGLPRRPRHHEAIRRICRLGGLKDADFRQIQAVYLGMVSYADWLLGQLMEALEATNHANDTALFFFADHGDFAGDWGLVEKWPNGMTDDLTRIPLIARVPGFSRGVVSTRIVEQFDVMATCLELAGIRANHTHFARSLIPQLQGRPGDPNRAAFCEGGYNTQEPQCFEPLDQFSNPENIYYPKVALQNHQPDTITRTSMIRTLEHKLIYRPDDQSEFYDLKTDPHEVHNLYGDATYRTHQEQLFHQMMDWYVRTADVAPRQTDARGLPRQENGG